MYILGIDTATKVCSVALAHDAEIIAEYTADAGTTHSQRLLPELDNLLNRAEVAKKDIDLVAVSMGPGSFTGLRIGLATAEAFAYARHTYLHGVDTLAALAYNCRFENILLSPVIDAQKGNYYQALYKWRGNKFVCVEPTMVVNVEQLFGRVGDNECLLMGECGKINNFPGNIKKAPENLLMPKAKSICALALRDFNSETDKRIFGLEPYYIRKSEAEELWEQRNR
ncbi:MAG: tRNA (adenosine(37)-N6)-threonylcarbamoyltransferase complex dimerization subunit type 1 TsaB [Phascolarctobacterium sp.]|nr:tRNA (adenosine(37)-N6)-threonylcarbamoyltransferase complex dimerization subunit type 1 TsaB [Candidatus Phascolarctobacterium caballi]